MNLTGKIIPISSLSGMLLYALLTAINITGQKSIWLVASSWLGVIIFSTLLIMVLKAKNSHQTSSPQ